MWPTIRDACVFQSIKTCVRPEGPNLAASGKQSQVSQDWSGGGLTASLRARCGRRPAFVHIFGEGRGPP